MSAPTLPTTVDGVLDAAAALIETRGLHKGDYAPVEIDNAGMLRTDGPLCAIGAINTALGGQPGGWDLQGERLQLAVVTITFAEQHPHLDPSLATWSDSHTQDEVVAGLRAAAQAWRDGAR